MAPLGHGTMWYIALYETTFLCAFDETKRVFCLIMFNCIKDKILGQVDLYPKNYEQKRLLLFIPSVEPSLDFLRQLSLQSLVAFLEALECRKSRLDATGIIDL